MRTRALFIVCAGALAGACAGSIPQTRYYQLAAPPGIALSARTHPGVVIAVEPLVADGAYDDARIVYRLDPVRLDYYDYHRWSTAPGAMTGAYLQQALARTGDFGAVLRETTPSTAFVLGGRITALEEVDVDSRHWVGHLALELTAKDAKSGAVVWVHTYDQRVPETVQSPEGLAQAIGVAMTRVVDAAAPELEQLAEREARPRTAPSATDAQCSEMVLAAP